MQDTSLHALPGVLARAFPGWTVLAQEDAFVVKTDEYEVWVTKTAIRNHHEILKKIRDDPAPAGVVREWTRYGYIVAIDFRPGSSVVVRCNV